MNIDQKSLSHGQLVHELKRRIRIIAPVLHKDAERLYFLEILLKKRDGILDMRTVPGYCLRDDRFRSGQNH